MIYDKGSLETAVSAALIIVLALKYIDLHIMETFWYTGKFLLLKRLLITPKIE
jgi:hypothetical protein